MKRATRHKIFITSRGISILTSLAGFVIIWSAVESAQTLSVQRLVMQFVVGFIIFAAGCGDYMAFRYIELYKKERERRKKDMASIRSNRIDAIIAELKSLERVDGESERLKVNAIKYLETYADRLDTKGVKTIKKCPGAATPDGHTTNNSNLL